MTCISGNTCSTNLAYRIDERLNHVPSIVFCCQKDFEIHDRDVWKNMAVNAPFDEVISFPITGCMEHQGTPIGLLKSQHTMIWGSVPILLVCFMRV